MVTTLTLIFCDVRCGTCSHGGAQPPAATLQQYSRLWVQPISKTGRNKHPANPSPGASFLCRVPRAFCIWDVVVGRAHGGAVHGGVRAGQSLPLSPLLLQVQPRSLRPAVQTLEWQAVQSSSPHQVIRLGRSETSQCPQLGLTQLLCALWPNAWQAAHAGVVRRSGGGGRSRQGRGCLQAELR